MNFFVCATPLHCLIAKEIIKLNKIKKNECFLFYFSYRNADVSGHNKQYLSLSKICSETYYLKINNFLFFYVLRLFFIFRNKKINSIFVANIDMPLIHFILSYAKAKKIYSYDDGVGNIVKNSVFYCKNKKIKIYFRDFFYKLLGNKYDLDKLKSETLCHYSIYKDAENVNNNVKWINPLDIFKVESRAIIEIEGKKNSAIVILGTVYHEVLEKKNDVLKLLDLIQSFINANVGSDIYYIPHPRCREVRFENVIELDTVNIAEIILLDLLNLYNKLNLYGFVSSAQFNINVPPVVMNHYFSSSLFKKEMRYYKLLAREFGFISYSIDSK
ncbi:hypothetical protein F6Q07_04270 [Pectobacterium parmentieri]|uniref:glycosyltransferase family 52 n=1 Tax=Pectobacterium parmentieri TaxID=1905730 RepID=UPI000EB5CE2F|nr:glycosyltransferase family 52 [Pectobacterium parmentieri]AYH02183.1 hypothetical protein C5E26_15210 [Pectobacterium parmentieri]AYH11002.1 hypothetical protein C5E24_15555 [Pectobacterium parmentieri]AYH18283.1 hypothetical protein C5E22_07230 [Pectobacterium parmentieri]AYH28449.1 hypothetical protein C5E20_15610 [Pectobacterium parmentieri]MBI0471871.1 hypothetical protein [Pectobacterium parmentieri]